MTAFTPFHPARAARHIAVPGIDADKYSRGVLGIITGSDRYPGAAVLGVEAAVRTGVGMVRYVGGPRVAEHVLAARPEVVIGEGRVQAWLIGSGTDHADPEADAVAAELRALAQGVPVVLDGGALERVTSTNGPVVLTPHAGELARLMGVERSEVASEPESWAIRAAERFGVTVLLKGHRTLVVGPGAHLVAASAPNWAATAGSGDVLGGILGSLLATHASAIAERPEALAELAATAAVLHGLAATRASGGGPIAALDIAHALPATIAELLASVR